MTIKELDAKSAALELVRLRWEQRLLTRVRSKVDDAHAHAVKGLTKRLKETADGRASLRHLGQSPSYQAAVERLNELWAWLVGPTQTSLKGKVRDAREAFLKEASWLWHPLVPEEIRSRSEHFPTQAEIRMIRAAAIHGSDPRKVLEGPILTAQRSLKAALEQAGQRSTPGRVEDDMLEAWRNRTTGSLSQTVTILLNDSVEYADTEAGRAMIHPDYMEVEI